MNSFKISVFFENDHVVAIDKPAGWLSVPSRMGVADERPCAGKILEAQLAVQLFPVHRLDEPVSGLLIFAKSSKAQTTLSSWFENRKVRKRYHAVTSFTARVWKWGQCPWKMTLEKGVLQTWECSLTKGKKRSFVDEKFGKFSKTQAILRAEDSSNPENTVLHWDLFPLTGRSHQLRVHLALGGYPILGDVLYGADSIDSKKESSIFLRSCELDFIDCEEAKLLDLPTNLLLPQSLR
jgi:tRNA pseudouridine32 synthase / 23S rRNA pseudouridine746 synthase